MVAIDVRKEGKLDNTQKTLPMYADATWDDPWTFLLNMSNEDFESINIDQFFEDITELTIEAEKATAENESADSEPETSVAEAEDVENEAEVEISKEFSSFLEDNLSWQKQERT